MKIKELNAEVGVIIARFMCAQLHEAHVELINNVRENHKRLIIVLGISPCKVTRNNPLDFESRNQMVTEMFPESIVLPIKDINNNEAWSKNLDEILNDIIGVGQKCIIYGGRDSFINCYSGKWKTCELESEKIISASKLREEIAIKPKPTKDFREGVIWAAMNQYATCYPTVDIAILNKNTNEILLGKKPNENKYRFIGGFAEPNSESYELDAIREVREETGLSITDLEYIGSAKIDDWRMRRELNKIKTLFFLGYYTFGAAKGNDDIEKTIWVKINELNENMIVDTHKPLLKMLIKYLKSENIIEYTGN